MTYHDDLIKDKKRVSVFKKAILEKSEGITFDLGTGSGILAGFASQKADHVYAFEINPLTIRRYTGKYLEKYDNVTIIEADAASQEFSVKPDVVICEMLDTALVDEQQIPVINNVLDYTKEDTTFIPQSTIDTIQLGKSNIKHITYREYGNTTFLPLTNEKTYNRVDFSTKTEPFFKKQIETTITEEGTVNSILITTYTNLTDEIMTEPTPMLNPPLLIPLDEKKVEKDEKIIIKLEYIMGGGLNTIKANYK